MKTTLRLLGLAALFGAAVPFTLHAQTNVVLSLKMSTNGLTGWQTIQTVVTNMPESPKAFYRMRIATTNGTPPPPTNSMALIPAGSFSMGNALSASGDGSSDELPVHTVDVSAFYMDKYEVSKALWDEVAVPEAAGGLKALYMAALREIPAWGHHAALMGALRDFPARLGANWCTAAPGVQQVGVLSNIPGVSGVLMPELIRPDLASLQQLGDWPDPAGALGGFL
jgi:formylglycine-generating enzyme required for sulfatase activity